MPDVRSPADTTAGSGVYNKRIVIEQPDDTPDGQGGVTRAWVTVVSTWAHITPWMPYRGGELFVADQVYPVQWLKVSLRYRPSTNITTTMRMRYGTKRYNIRAASVPEEAQTAIELVCEQLQASGTLH